MTYVNEEILGFWGFISLNIPGLVESNVINLQTNKTHKGTPGDLVASENLRMKELIILLHFRVMNHRKKGGRGL